MKLKQTDVVTGLLIFIAISDYASTAQFTADLTALATDPWPVKIQKAFAITSGLAAIILARVTGTSSAPPPPADPKS